MDDWVDYKYIEHHLKTVSKLEAETLGKLKENLNHFFYFTISSSKQNPDHLKCNFFLHYYVIY